MADLTTILSKFLADIYDGTLSGIITTFQGGNGSATAPTYSFSGQTTKGLWSPGTNIIALGVAESEALRIGGSTGISTGVGWFLTLNGVPGAATTSHKLIKKVTGIADAVATDVLTVTVPNANHAASVQLTFLSSNGSTDAFESSRTAQGAVVLARTTGVATVAAAATLELAQIATVGSGATHTLAYSLSAMTGAVGATQTFTVQVTINDSGNTGSNQIVVMAEVINAEATGVTIA